MTASDNDLNSRPAALQGKTRVLVIDDDHKLCRLIRDYLEPMGYEVSAAHSGTEGVERAVGEAWDAVILEVMLPGMDGFEAVKAIRRTSELPVLMLTARGEEADRIVGWEMGVDDYLPRTSRLVISACWTHVSRCADQLERLPRKCVAFAMAASTLRARMLSLN